MRGFLLPMSPEQSYLQYLEEHDPQAAVWLKRLMAIEAEVSALSESELQSRFHALTETLRQKGKIILEAGKDWQQIYELNKQSHSMQAPFCDTSGYGMNMPSRYVVLNNADLRGRVTELMTTIEYPLYNNK